MNVTDDVTGYHENNTTSTVSQQTELDDLLGPLYMTYYEGVMMICVFLLFLIICLFGNILSLVFIARDERLHTPHMAAIACHAFADIVIGSLWFGQTIYTLCRGDADHFINYRAACFFERSISVFWSLGQIQNLGVLALERLIYYKYPWRYMRLVTIRKVVTIEACVYIVAFLYVICNARVGESRYSVTLLHCSLYSTPWYLAVTVSVWFIPPVLVVMTMVATLSLLAHKQRIQVLPQRSQFQQHRSVHLGNAPHRVGTGQWRMGERQKDIYLSNGSQHETCQSQDSTGQTFTNRNNGIFQVRPDDENEADVDLEYITEFPLYCASPSALACRDLQTWVDSRQRNYTITSHNPSISCSNTGHGGSAQMKKAMKLVGYISLGLYLTYIPCTIVAFRILSDVPAADLEPGRHPGDYYKPIRVIYALAFAVSTVIDPFLYFCFNHLLKRALYKLLGIRMPVD